MKLNSSLLWIVNLKKPTREQSKYWDSILSKANLGKYRGEGSKTSYRGTANDLIVAEQDQVMKKLGFPKKKGHGPD